MKFASLLLCAAVLAPHAPAQSPPQTPKPAPVWVKLQEALDTTFTRPGDKFSAVTQEETTLNGVTLAKGTRLNGHVVKSVNQDRKHANAGLVLVFDSVVRKDGGAVPVQANMVSLAPSHGDEIPQEDNASPAPINAGNARMEAFLYKDGSNEGAGRATKSTKVNGVVATSSVVGVYLFVAPDANSSGVVVARDGKLELQKWTRIKLMLTAR
jgi:hypothetical protein